MAIIDACPGGDIVGLEIPFLVIPFVLTAFGAIYLSGEAWRRSRSPGSQSFSLIMLVIVVWLMASAANQVSELPGQKIFWAKVTYFGVAWLGTLWFTFSIEFTNANNRFLDKYGWILWIIPSLTILIVATNELHGFMWSEIQPAPDGSGALIYKRNWWFALFTGYSYSLFAIGSGILIRAIINFPLYQRRQVAALVLGMMLPWAANISYAVGWIPQTSIDLTPFAFTITGIIYTWGLFRLRLFDPTPRAREFIIEQMGEGYIAVDDHDLILDINPLARKLLRIDGEHVIGRPVREILSPWPVLIDLLRSNTQACIELQVDSGLYLEASLTPWFTRRDQRYAGRIIIFYDVTQRKKTEEKLQESEQLYRLLVDTSPFGIARISEDGRVTYASPQIFELLKLNPNEDLIGTPILEWVYPEDRHIAEKQLERADQVNFLASTCRLVRSDKTVFWGDVTSTTVVDDQGRVCGKLLTIRDITERKNLEVRLEMNLEQQRFINDLLQILFRPHDHMKALSEALELIGKYTQASRIYLCHDSIDGQETSIELEWCDEDTKPRARETPLFRYSVVPAWRRDIEEHGVVIAPLDENALQALSSADWLEEISRLTVEKDRPVREDIAEYMDAWGIRSFAAFPIYGAEERLYGFLGVDYCCQEQIWSGEALALLWNVCKIVSGAVAQKQVEDEEHRQRAITEALQDTAQALNSTLNSEEVLDRILANLEKVAPYDAASIAMVDEEGTIRFVRWRGYDEKGAAWLRTSRMTLDDRGTYRQMTETGQPLIIADTWLEKVWRVHEEFTWIRSYAGVPIQIKGKIVGFINVDSSQPDFFTPDIISRLHVFADQAAVAIENARLYHSAKQRADEMSTLYRIGLTLTAGLEMNVVLLGLFEQCRQVLPIDVFYVALFNEETKIIDHPFFYNNGVFDEVPSRNIETNPGLSGAVILERRTIYLPDVIQAMKESQYQIIRLGGRLVRSYVGVPLIVLNRVVGVLSMQNFEPHAYSPEQIRLLETIATQAAIAVQNARLYDQMRQMAITDSVTGLFNRRHFIELGRGEVERALRYNRAMSVLMVDIDHFKLVNDTYGHGTGDQVIQAVARICRQVLRTTDIVARWGGEEFTIILPETDMATAVMIAERIRRVMEQTEIVIAEGMKIRVTISVGIAEPGPDYADIESVVSCADFAMYVAKQAGRNRVECYKAEKLIY